MIPDFRSLGLLLALLVLAGCATTRQSVDLPVLDNWETRKEVLANVRDWEFKGRIAFLGGIDTQQLLVHGSPQQIADEVRRVKTLLGPNLIVSPSHEALLPSVSPENVLAELRMLWDLGLRNVHMYADLFTVNREQVMGLCEGMVREGLDFRWTCNSRVDFVDPEMLGAMARAGCWLTITPSPATGRWRSPRTGTGSQRRGGFPRAPGWHAAPPVPAGCRRRESSAAPRSPDC